MKEEITLHAYVEGGGGLCSACGHSIGHDTHGKSVSGEPPRAEPPRTNICPSCLASDNTPYTDANGVQMRACGRCMIQWRANPEDYVLAGSRPSAPAPSAQEPVSPCDKGISQALLYASLSRARPEPPDAPISNEGGAKHDATCPCVDCMGGMFEAKHEAPAPQPPVVFDSSNCRCDCNPYCGCPCHGERESRPSRPIENALQLLRLAASQIDFLEKQRGYDPAKNITLQQIREFLTVEEQGL